MERVRVTPAKKLEAGKWLEGREVEVEEGKGGLVTPSSLCVILSVEGVVNELRAMTHTRKEELTPIIPGSKRSAAINPPTHHLNQRLTERRHREHIFPRPKNMHNVSAATPLSQYTYKCAWKVSTNAPNKTA